MIMSQVLLTFITLQIENIYTKTELEVSLTYVGLHTGPPVCFSTNPISVKPREVALLTLVALDWSNGPSKVI